jgi:hypothetical protein
MLDGSFVLRSTNPSTGLSVSTVRRNWYPVTRTCTRKPCCYLTSMCRTRGERDWRCENGQVARLELVCTITSACRRTCQAILFAICLRHLKMSALASSSWLDVEGSMVDYDLWTVKLPIQSFRTMSEKHRELRRVQVRILPVKLLQSGGRGSRRTQWG